MTNKLMGDKADWLMIYNMIPELYYLLSMVIILGILRGFSKIWIVIKSRSGDQLELSR